MHNPQHHVLFRIIITPAQVTITMDAETIPPSAQALLPCLLPLDTLKKIRDQNLLVLGQVDTLKRLLNREKNREEKLEELFQWKEYRLHGKPKSLKEFLDLFLLENGKYDENLAIWIPDRDAFVCIKRVQRAFLPRAYREGEFKVTLSSDNHRYQSLSVFSSTVEQAMSCLEFLFGLHDSHFEGLDLSYNVPEDDAGGPPICPLTNRCLEKLLLQNEKRENQFNRMAFTPEQSSVLAASGTNIGFYACCFPDGGVAFVDTARQHSSLTKLIIHERLPFDDIHFVWCLDYLNLEYLGLSYLTLDDGQTCRAVAATEINYLRLDCCKFEDEEAVQALVDNVRAERGPKGLSLEEELFESPEMLGDFMTALRGNTYLERLDLGCLNVNDGDFQALVAALPENRGLTHLGLTFCTVNDRCWDKLMGAIAGHPSLRTLSFEEICDENESSVFERHDAMHSLAGMLAENEHVDDIQVDFWHDHDVWDAVVVPRLEINLYRKRFRAVEAIGLDKTRAAVVARALARIALADLRSESSLIFMVLSQNCDVFCSYLDEILTRDNNISVLSRKRGLPSEDTTGPL
jgi:hypothetical protein